MCSRLGVSASRLGVCANRLGICASRLGYSGFSCYTEKLLCVHMYFVCCALMWLVTHSECVCSCSSPVISRRLDLT